MVNVSDLARWTDEGKQAFEAGQFEPAAGKFEQAAKGYAELNDPLNAAELRNNLSVALLRAGRCQAALDAVLGTDQVFEGAGDRKRQAMAIGNRAAALEGLKRWDEAVADYERSADLFAQAGEGDLRAMVLKSAAAVKLRRGKLADSAFKMIGSLEAKEKPSIFERVLKFFLRFAQR